MKRSLFVLLFASIGLMGLIVPVFYFKSTGPPVYTQEFIKHDERERGCPHPECRMGHERDVIANDHSIAISILSGVYLLYCGGIAVGVYGRD